jgi:uncharacterized protein YbaP (TraB family)
MNLIRLVAIVLSGISFLIYADSPVWKISDGSRVLYIGGTIHVLSPEDYPLPAEFDLAYQRAEQLVLETDMEQMLSPAFLPVLMQRLTYTDGKSLKQFLSDNTYQKLNDYLTSRGIPIAGVLSFKPGMILSMITLVELQRLGQAGMGVDEYFSTKAKNEGKKMGQLETLDQQLDFISSMGEGDEDAFFVQMLEDLQRLPEILKSMKSAWRAGDTKKLEDIALKPLALQSPQVYDDLLLSRNKQWLPKIESMLRSEEVELILVGALHLVGVDGLLQQLSLRGYTVEALSTVN